MVHFFQKFTRTRSKIPNKDFFFASACVPEAFALSTSLFFPSLQNNKRNNKQQQRQNNTVPSFFLNVNSGLYLKTKKNHLLPQSPSRAVSTDVCAPEEREVVVISVLFFSRLFCELNF